MDVSCESCGCARCQLSATVGEEPWTSAYMPNVMYEEDTSSQQQGQKQQQGLAMKGIVFVATRQLQDEELLLNYRLNPQVQKPAWYTAVDVEEDKRRWY